MNQGEEGVTFAGGGGGFFTLDKCVSRRVSEYFLYLF